MAFSGLVVAATVFLAASASFASSQSLQGLSASSLLRFGLPSSLPPWPSPPSTDTAHKLMQHTLVSSLHIFLENILPNLNPPAPQETTFLMPV